MNWIRHIIPLMHQLSGGRYCQNAEAFLSKMEPQEQEQFFRFLQTVEQERISAKRTVRLFPGGPAIRM